MSAPVIDQAEPTVEVLGETDGEMRVRFPLIVIEGLDTADGRYIAPDALTARALPLTILAQTKSQHGGDQPPAAVTVGRLDTIERVPGPEVISKQTGEPFAEGTFVWRGTGTISTSKMIDGDNVADFVRRRFLRFVSADLLPQDYELFGIDGSEQHPDDPSLHAIVHRGELAGLTIVPISAFGDCYLEIDDDLPEPVTADELPEGLAASAFPSWRSAEIGDPVSVIAAGKGAGTYVEQMRDRLGAELGNDEIAGWGENADLLLDLYTLLALTRGADVTSQEVHDAWSVAIQRSDPGHRSLLPFDELAPDVQAMDDMYRDAIAAAASGDAAPEAEAPIEDTVTAAAAEGPHTGGMIALIPANAAELAVDGGDPVDELHLTLAYLGEDVTGWDDTQRAEILAVVEQAAAGAGQVGAEVMGHAAFNPTGANDREPCAVYLVSGPDLPAMKAAFVDQDTSDHPVFLPHVTAGYGLDPAQLSFVGPVTFDRLRVALGDEITDYPLGGPAADLDDGTAMAASPLPDEVVDPALEPGAGGYPESPQACQYGDEPAVRSILFRDEDAYVPVCDKHEQEAREQLEAAGEVIVGVVDIEPDTAEDAPVDEPSTDDAVVAAAAPRPPADWFADPQLDGPTALRVTEDGRVFGHLAAWDVPHIGMPGQRITAPRSATGYAYFRTGAVIVDDGTEVAVGHITLDTGHAGTDLGRHAAAAHYDHTGTVVADVAAGEDKHGIWVAGALRSHVDEQTAAKLRASALSGDWRRVGSSLELVAALGVNTPGFPIPRSRVASGMPLSLVAAGALPPRLDDIAIDSKRISDMAVNGLAFGQISAGKLGARLVISDGGVTFYNADGTELRVAAPADLAGIESREDLVAAVEQRLEEKRAAGELTAQHAALLDELDDTPALVASLLDELDDTPARFAALLDDLTDEEDGDFNWVDDVGGLPKYIKRIQKHLEQKGMTESHAIATAVNAAKKMCATGDLNFPGAQQVNPGSRAEACAAVADWEAKKARAKAS